MSRDRKGWICGPSQARLMPLSLAIRMLLVVDATASRELAMARWTRYKGHVAFGLALFKLNEIALYHVHSVSCLTSPSYDSPFCIAYTFSRFSYTSRPPIYTIIRDATARRVRSNHRSGDTDCQETVVVRSAAAGCSRTHFEDEYR